MTKNYCKVESTYGDWFGKIVEIEGVIYIEYTQTGSGVCQVEVKTTGRKVGFLESWQTS